MNGRNLQLLLVNDNTTDLHVEHIDIVKCPTPFGADGDEIQRWYQHMFMWATGNIPTFDLLLIDIKFDDDNTAPCPDINALGLLHALPLAGRQGLTSLPFVWGIHSGDPSTVSKDPIAVFAFGLLSAMSHRSEWSQLDPSDMTARFSSELERIPAEGTALRDLLEPYRKKLVEESGLSIVVEVPSQTIELARGLEDSSEETDDGRSRLLQLGNSSVLLWAGDDAEAIRLRSLFADFSMWNPSVISNHVLPFLLAVQKRTIGKDLYPVVEAAVNEVKRMQDGEWQLGGSKVSPNDILKRLVPNDKQKRDRVAVGMILCLWLERFQTKSLRSAGQLLFDLGLKEGSGDGDFTTPKRWLHGAGFHRTLTWFLRALEDERLGNPVFHELGRSYWQKHIGGGRLVNLPRCIDD